MRRPIALACFVLALLVAVDAASAAVASPGPAPTAKVQKRKACKLKRNAKCRKTAVSGQRVGKVSLKGIRLQGAKVTNTTFRGTDLTRASFKGATLRKVTFSRVRLTAASFAGAKLQGVRFDHVTFQAAHATRCVVQGSHTFGCSRTGADFHSTAVTDATFMYSDLAAADFSRTTLTRVEFRSVSLYRADFTGSVWVSSQLYSDGATPTVDGSKFKPRATQATFDGSVALEVGTDAYPSFDVSFATFADADNVKIHSTGADVRGVWGIGAETAGVAVAAADAAAKAAARTTTVYVPSPDDRNVLFEYHECDLADACAFRHYVVGAVARYNLAATQPEFLVGQGIGCGAPSRPSLSVWVTTCTGAIPSGGVKALQFLVAASHALTVLRDSSLAPGHRPTVVVSIAKADGAVVGTTTCATADDASCVVRVPDGMQATVSASLSGAGVFLTLNCPGAVPVTPPVIANPPDAHATCSAVTPTGDLQARATSSS